MSDWYANGTYYESCNCEAICPCRPQGDRPGGDSTYGICQFVTSWWIAQGRADGVDLSGCRVVLAGHYDDDEPAKPWTVVLYLDARSTPQQRDVLADLYLRRLPFSAAIGEVKAVRSATIELDHTRDAQAIEVGPYITVRTREPVPHTERVSCAIPGHGHPGREIIAEINRVEDEHLNWSLHGRCGFATDFAYAS